MALGYVLSLILLLNHNVLWHCASAAVHSHIHSVDNIKIERESDGSYRSRDYDHYNDAGHNTEFDHEAILGSVKEAEEYDKLSPDEAKERLSLLLPKMDTNGDQYIDRTELKLWILNSFINLSREETEERMSEVDDNRDGSVSWTEYLQDAFGVDAEEEIGTEDTGDSGMVMLVRDEKLMFMAADVNGDGSLDFSEFEVFTNPEEHASMHPFLVNQTLREKDSNGDGRLDLQEYIGNRASHEESTWLVSEKDKFEHDLDLNGDGSLDLHEITKWVIPDNEEIAEEEVDHLMSTADENGDGRLAFSEVLAHYHVFVGSEADHSAHAHYPDEL